MKLAKKALSSLLAMVIMLTLILSFSVVTYAASNEETIYNYLKNTMGLNTAAACGVIANIYCESGFNPNAVGDNGTSYGICQWHNSRWTNLKNYCNNHGYDWQTLNGQLHYLEYELQASYPGVYNTLKSVSNDADGAYNAGYKWCYSFEVPANYPSVSVTRGNLAKNTYWPKYGGSSHIVNTGYGTEFQAYPKATITAENIYDGNHSQISSTAWIGTSDLCTIHEVYTDGCCKLTYPLDSGGSRTVYSKIALFNIHTHSFTGQRVYEAAHPHEITQRCVDFDTCGGYILTGEYYQVKTCQQCWYATFDLSATSVSLKVGESKTISAVIQGFFPDSVVASADYDSSIIEMTSTSQSLTFKGLKPGTCTFKIIVYNDSTKTYIIGSDSISITVTQSDTTKPNASISSTNSVASSQNVTLIMSDDVGLVGYYWGTSSSTSPSFTSISGTSKSINVTVGSSGTYYLTVKDTSGNVYQTSRTFYKTTLNANGGSVSPTSVLTASGNSFTFPTPTRSGYTYIGWSTSSTSSSGITSITPSGNTTYYAVWTLKDTTSPSGSISTTNNVASSQNVTLSMSDNVGLAGYYWGTSSSSSPSFTSVSGMSYSLSTTVYSSGTYYLTVKDTNGNIFQTSKTFYNTTLNANGGSVSPTSILTASGNSFTFPTPTRSGYIYGGWATSSTATSGITALTPTSNATYYAVWSEEVTVTSISIAELPDKTVYYIGDELDTTGLRISVTFSNGVTNTTPFGFTTSGFSSTSPGTKTITVTLQDKHAYFDVTVKTPSVTLSNNSLSMTVGEIRSISATPDPADQTIIWTSSDESIATVSNGIIIAKAPGTVNIKAKFTYNGINYQKNCSVTITQVKHTAGDTDGDGEVSDWDAILLTRYLAGWDVEIDLLAADVDGDGEVSDWDAITLERYLAGWDITLK